MQDVALAMWAAAARLPSGSKVGRDLDMWAERIDASGRRRTEPSVEALDLPYAIAMPLWRAGVHTIPDLVDRVDDGSIVALRQIGPKRAAEIHDALEQWGGS